MDKVTPLLKFSVMKKQPYSNLFISEPLINQTFCSTF